MPLRIQDSDSTSSDDTHPGLRSEADMPSSVFSSDFAGSLLASGPESSLSEDEEQNENESLYEGQPSTRTAARHHALPAGSLTDAQRQELRSQLAVFLNTPRFVRAIRSMCSSNGQSIAVNYADLTEFHSVLDSNPRLFMFELDAALSSVVKLYFPLYSEIRSTVRARIFNLPVSESLRDLRNSHLGHLVRVRGIVTRRSAVFSRHALVRFLCLKCHTTFGPFSDPSFSSSASPAAISGASSRLNTFKPSACFECQSRGPFAVNSSETVYRDVQHATLQEVPGTVPPGTLPRSREVLFYDDLVDSCRPGDEIELTGIYENNVSFVASSARSSTADTLRSSFPLFSTVIEAVHVEQQSEDLQRLQVSGGLFGCDEKELRALAVASAGACGNFHDSRDSAVVATLVASFAPSIFGHRSLKLALLLAMVGGNSKEERGMAMRGDINVLMLGDPGTAKSQLLRYVAELSPRSVLATGQGSSAVGLTASVKRDLLLKEWTLEGGALVLADRGICCIDEFDKMSEVDRVSIHEAMEQQSISISKAGIVASLHARCAVIAAANPVRGTYSPNLSFAQNSNLSDPIVSRFDLLLVVRDVIDVAEDALMADFVLNSHSPAAVCGSAVGDAGNVSSSCSESHRTKDDVAEEGEEVSLEKSSFNCKQEESRADNEKNETERKETVRKETETINEDSSNDKTQHAKTLSQEKLRAYIALARSIRPVLSEVDLKKIVSLYSELRRESIASGVPITVRHIESIVRISEAFAKLRLSERVSEKDVDAAIGVSLESFLGAQRQGVAKQLRKKFRNFLSLPDFDSDEAALDVLRRMVAERLASSADPRVPCCEFLSRCSNSGISVSQRFFSSVAFSRARFALRDGIIQRVL